MPRAWAGEAAAEYLADIREADPIYCARESRPSRHAAEGDEQGAGRQRHSGPVDTRRQPDAAVVRRAGPATKSPPRAKSPPITTRRATVSSSSTRWSSPTARRRWRIATTSRSTSRASRRRRRANERRASRATDRLHAHTGGQNGDGACSASVFLQNTLTAMASFAGRRRARGCSGSFQPSAKPLPELRKILVTPSPAESIERRWQQSSPIALARYGSSRRASLPGEPISISLPTRSSHAQCSWRSAST